MIIYLKNKQTLKVDDFYFKCCIGKKGLSSNKSEGDKKTPKGIFSLDNLYYRNDRVKLGKLNLKKKKIRSNMGWCDDVSSSKYYNKLIKTNINLSYEKLFRKDNKYDLIIPIKKVYKNNIKELNSQLENQKFIKTEIYKN